MLKGKKQNSAKKKKKSRVIKIKNIKTNFIQQGSFDVIFACIVLLLFTIGIIAMYSASYAYANYNEGNANEFFVSQLQNAVVGFLFMAVLSKVDYKVYNGRFALFAYAATVIVLIITLFAGSLDGETTRWLKIGPIHIQPSEFAKFTLIIVMSYMICVMKNALRAPRNKFGKFTPDKDGLSDFERKVFSYARTPFSACVLLAIVAVSYFGLVLLEKHYSAAILLMLMAIAIAWLSGTRKVYFAALFAVIGAVVAIVIINPSIIDGFGFAASRIMCWLDKDNPIYIENRRQTVNGLYAIGSGGLFGVGLGNSKQKQLYIPEPQNDFVFPVFCEEFGFIGAAVVLILFAALICRGFVIAAKCKNYFGSLVVMGIMIQIALQVIINISVVTDLIPNTGMALPFFSYGGTALLVLLSEMGIVLSVSRDSSVEKE